MTRITEMFPEFLIAEKRARKEVRNFLQEMDFGVGECNIQRIQALGELEKEVIKYTKS